MTESHTIDITVAFDTPTSTGTESRAIDIAVPFGTPASTGIFASSDTGERIPVVVLAIPLNVRETDAFRRGQGAVLTLYVMLWMIAAVEVVCAVLVLIYQRFPGLSAAGVWSVLTLVFDTGVIFLMLDGRSATHVQSADVIDLILRVAHLTWAGVIMGVVGIREGLSVTMWAVSMAVVFRTIGLLILSVIVRWKMWLTASLRVGRVAATMTSVSSVTEAQTDGSAVTANVGQTAM